MHDHRSAQTYASANPAFALASSLRVLAGDGIGTANSSHPGASMSMAGAANMLWDGIQGRADRDRSVLWKGPAPMLICSLRNLTGYAILPRDEVRRFPKRGTAVAAATRRAEPTDAG